MAQLGQVAVQTHQFLVHRYLVSVNGRLGQDAGLVQLGVLEHLGHLAPQPCAIVGHNAGRPVGHLFCEPLDGRGPVQHIPAQPLPFPLPHGVEVRQSQLQHRA